MEVRKMKVRRKSLAGLAVLSAIAIAITGCATAETPAEATSVSVLASGNPELEGVAYDEIAALFAEAGEAEASVELSPFDTFLASATTKARSGDLGDVVQILPGAQYESLVQSLTPMTPADISGGDALGGWEATPFDSANPDGTFAGAPVGGQGIIWYYNKELFAQAGLDPEAPPSTWEEFMEAARALKAAGITPIGQSGADSFLLWWAWGAMSGQYFTTEEARQMISGELELTDPRFVEMLSKMRELYTEELINADYADKAFSDLEASFGAGEVAMVPGIISVIMNWKVWDENLGKDAYGVFAPPQIKGTPLSAFPFSPVFVWGVSAEATNPEGAKKFVETVTSKEGQTILLDKLGQFPNRGDVDVFGVTGSNGAAAILKVIEDRGAVESFTSFLNGSATSAALANLTLTMQSGDIEGFLANLEQQQRG